eukprot:14715_1
MKLSYIGILGFLAAARCEGTTTPSEVYNSPTHHGKLVDWCLHFDPQDCGQKAADLYCDEKDLGPAVKFEKRRTYNEVTLTMDEHSTCTPEDNVCIAFEFIACSVLEQRYDDPVMHEYALDGCYEYTKQCGDDAADAFCQQNGYVEAFDYAQIPAEGEEKYSND